MIAETEAVVRLLVALVLGGLIGVERELGHKPAGLRTHMLVSMGACLFTLLSLQFELDPARVAAGVVVGIGFIGAGTIISTRGHIQGITTAACLWVSAALGLACGLGNFLLATLVAVVAFLILQIKRIEEKLL